MAQFGFWGFGFPKNSGDWGTTGLVGLNQPAAINKSESLKMQLPVNGKKASEQSNRKKELGV